MVETNGRNMAFAGIGVFAASSIAYMAYQAADDESDNEIEEDLKSKTDQDNEQDSNEVPE